MEATLKLRNRLNAAMPTTAGEGEALQSRGKGRRNHSSAVGKVTADSRVRQDISAKESDRVRTFRPPITLGDCKLGGYGQRLFAGLPICHNLAIVEQAVWNFSIRGIE